MADTADTINVPSASGLDDVVVARTALSLVDGERGRLIIRGYPVEELAGRAGFEDVCALLWHGAWPSVAEREAMRDALSHARLEAFRMLPSIGTALKAADGMDALRTALSHFAPSGDLAVDRVRLTAAVPVFSAAWIRGRFGLAPVPPQAHLWHTADALQMLGGTEPSTAATTGLDAYLSCVVDHGLNASTFTARIVASTASDIVSAVVAALGALKGPLHGGAPGPVLDMLDAIGSPSEARAWLERELDAGHRIMGMGHRIYRVRDPRAAALERAVHTLDRNGLTADRLPLALAVEREAERLLAERHPGRNLHANVEFYTAVLLDAVGIPRTLFTPTFVASRVVGWCAHFEEQRRVGRLIRPAATYVGPDRSEPSRP